MSDAELQNRQLLTHLADGQFHSGEVLGRLLGISRAAIWKRLQRLQESAGIAIERRHGKGYRIDGGLDLLDAAAIRAQLDPEALRQ
ncbi:MAG TPA: HTH domain-containing protein, partial [Pseudomonadales bacterium]|nr:HTH domain-containing protein [Pseudomonadales bacterium]